MVQLLGTTLSLLLTAPPRLLTPCMSIVCNRLGLSMRHALFNTTFVGTDARKETDLPQSARHEATKDTIEMFLQTVSDAQSVQVQAPSPYVKSDLPRVNQVHGSPKEGV
jgi:hypothetical protein